MSFDKSEINKSFYLSLSDAIYGVSNNYGIKEIGKSCNYGNIILYDSRNPYNLPTFTYSAYTYVVYPIMREQYSYEEAISVCAGLNEMGRSDWFIPNQNELIAFFMTLDMYSREEYPSGDYTTLTKGNILVGLGLLDIRIGIIIQMGIKPIYYPWHAINNYHRIFYE